MLDRLILMLAVLVALMLAMVALAFLAGAVATAGPP